MTESVLFLHYGLQKYRRHLATWKFQCKDGNSCSWNITLKHKLHGCYPKRLVIDRAYLCCILSSYPNRRKPLQVMTVLLPTLTLPYPNWYQTLQGHHHNGDHAARRPTWCAQSVVADLRSLSLKNAGVEDGFIWTRAHGFLLPPHWHISPISYRSWGM